MKMTALKTKTVAYREKLIALKVGEFIEVADKTEWSTLYNLVSNMNKVSPCWRVTSRKDILTGDMQYRGWRIQY